MPSKSQIVLSSQLEKDQKMPIAFGALKQLGWKIAVATDEQIVANTIRTWKRYDQEISLEFVGEELQITSKMVHGEAFDLGKLNQKNIDAFSQAFEQVKTGSTEEQIQQWKSEMEQVTETTVQEAIETQQAMNPNGGNAYATYGILAINVLLFIAMAVSGVNIFEPDGNAIFEWGGNYGPATSNGEIWRLFSNMFIHIGIVHLLFNSYALFIVGTILEPMLGKARYIAIYLATGVVASVASMWWHSGDPIVSAGASGAIFGLNGAMLALLTTNLIPAAVRKNLLQAFGILVGYNLLYGLNKSNVDNAAHIGGLLAGLILGYILYWQLSRERKTATDNPRPSAIWVYLAVVVLAVGSIWYSQNFSPRAAPTGAFNTVYTEFAALEEKALAVIANSDSSTRESMVIDLQQISIPAWQKAADLWTGISTDQFTEPQKKFAGLAMEYAAARLQEAEILLKMNQETPEPYYSELESKTNEVQRILNEIANITADQ